MAGGRPSKFDQRLCEQAMKLCRLGATDKELADFFGVAESTLSKWKVDHVEFSDALKQGKERADAEVADKLFKRATGYSHEAVKIFADAKTGAEHVVAYTEHYAPDTTACIFWLKNRRPDLWRDVTRQEQTGKDGGPIVHQAIKEMTDEELESIASGRSGGTAQKA